MTPKQAQLALAAITLAGLVGIIVLLGLGIGVPTELYALTSLGFGGHLALSQPTSSGPAAAASVGLSELLRAAQLLSPVTAAPSQPAATTAPLGASPAAPRAPAASDVVTLAPIAAAPVGAAPVPPAA